MKREGEPTENFGPASETGNIVDFPKAKPPYKSAYEKSLEFIDGGDLEAAKARLQSLREEREALRLNALQKVRDQLFNGGKKIHKVQEIEDAIEELVPRVKTAIITKQQDSLNSFRKAA